MSAEKLYNINKLSEFLGNDATQVKEMILVFLQSVPNDIKQIKELADSQDWDEVYKVVHRVKPSLDVFEMKELLSDGKKIEILANDNNSSGNIEKYINRFVGRLEETILMLQEEVKDN